MACVHNVVLIREQSTSIPAHGEGEKVWITTSIPTQKFQIPKNKNHMLINYINNALTENNKNITLE